MTAETNIMEDSFTFVYSYPVQDISSGDIVWSPSSASLLSLLPRNIYLLLLRISKAVRFHSLMPQGRSFW